MIIIKYVLLKAEYEYLKLKNKHLKKENEQLKIELDKQKYNNIELAKLLEGKDSD